MQIERKYLVLAAFAIFIVLFMSLIALAEDENKDALSAKLGRALANINCKIDFIKGIINSTLTAIPEGEGNLSGFIAVFEDDEKNLQNYADKGDREGFKNYVKEKVEKDLKEARKAVHNWRSMNAGNVSKEERKALKDDYASLRAEFQECHFNSLKSEVRGRIEAYNTILGNYVKMADRYEERGANVSLLRDVIDDARIQVITPLENIAGNATDINSLNAAFKKYCLFNGCKNGFNFHLAKKFEIAKINSVIEYLRANQNASEASNKYLDTAKENIDSASDILSKIGTGKYSEEQEKTFLESVKAAYDALKEARRLLRGVNNG